MRPHLFALWAALTVGITLVFTGVLWLLIVLAIRWPGELIATTIIFSSGFAAAGFLLGKDSTP